MPGAYLAAILVSVAGVAAIDARWRLAAWRTPGRTAAAVGIATGVFVKGSSPLLLGVDIAPQLPLEEPFFLAFLCYLALVLWAGAGRLLGRRTRSDAGPASSSRAEAP